MTDLAECRLQALPVTFTTGEAERAGVWRRELYRLRDAGVVQELSRGVFRRADAPQTAYLDLLAVSRRAPTAVVCLLSALSVHELTDEVPAAVQIAVPRGTHRPRIAYPPTEVSEFDTATFELGTTELEVAPAERVRIYDPPRSVVDAMRLRHRIGEPVALQALRRYLGRADTRPARLLELARALDVEGPLRQAASAVLS